MSSYSMLTGKSKHRWPKLLVIFIIILSVLVVGSVVFIRQKYVENLKPVSASQKVQLVTVPTGATAKEIAKILQDAGVIRAGWAFEWYVRNNNLRDKLQAGTYNLRPNQSVEEIVALMTQGQIATNLVTILPAQRLDQVKRSFANSGFSESEIERAFDPSLYADHPALVDKPRGANLEGYLYPESFQKTAETKPETIIRASLDEMQKYLTPELRAGIVRQGLTVHEGVILASVIEQEVSNPNDKPVVAQVFLKRLKEGIALESDPTAFYGAILDGKTPTLTYESPYNTYKNKGLMPTPISNVSKSSLAAVASPSPTDYLFFVAGDDGKTYFSRTLQEHQQLTREHCKKLCSL
jgi:UPF0755 protein